MGAKGHGLDGPREDRQLVEMLRDAGEHWPTAYIIVRAAHRLEARLDAAEALQAELDTAKETVRCFVAYAEKFPQDIGGALAEDFLPKLARLSAAEAPQEASDA